MKTNGKYEVIARIAGPGLVLAALLALVLAGSIAGRAQASATTPAVPAATLAKAAPAAQPAAQPAQTAAPGKPAPKGAHEGVTVHGHWVIEVRNPDGTLVSHTEFHNALDTNGAATLSNVLLGQFAPGGYGVVLYNSAGGGPCQSIKISSTATVTDCYLVGSLISPEPAAFGDGYSQCGGTGLTNQISATGPCFPLSISAISGGGLAFTGTAVASSTVSITNVALNPLLCNALTGNVGPGDAVTAPNTCAQGEANEYELTRATLATPVTISAVGQLISVNVQITFSSGT